MKFNEKLIELRKSKNLTQEQLAEQLYVSRTAVSKWEQDRGYPSIDTLKALADYFDVSVDNLISNEEILSLTKDNIKRDKKRFVGLIVGLLDLAVLLFLLLPIFRLDVDGNITSVLIYKLNSSIITFALYYTGISLIILDGILLFVFMLLEKKITKVLIYLSLGLYVFLIAVFLLTHQPYPGVLALVFLVIEAIFVIKK